MFLFYTPWKRVKKGNIGLKRVDNWGRKIISIQNNATLIDGINRQNTTSTSASNNNVINVITIFISEKFKGSCQWYFKSDIAEFQFDYTSKIKLKTFIDKIRSLTKFSIFSSSLFKGTLMQIRKSPFIFVFIQKWYPENFVFLFLRFLELHTRKVCEMFVYKHKETTEYVKN